MPLLNGADMIYLGATPAVRVYLGMVLVWPIIVPPGGAYGAALRLGSLWRRRGRGRERGRGRAIIQQPVIAPDMLGAARHLVDELERLRPEIAEALNTPAAATSSTTSSSYGAAGTGRLWTTPGSFMLVESRYPRRCTTTFLAGGVLEELVALHDEVIAAALDDGACKLTLTGRKGWVRALKGWGWREVMTTVEKEITT